MVFASLLNRRGHRGTFGGITVVSAFLLNRYGLRGALLGLTMASAFPLNRCGLRASFDSIRFSRFFRTDMVPAVVLNRYGFCVTPEPTWHSQNWVRRRCRPRLIIGMIWFSRYC